MKEYVQKPGVRPWHGDELVNLQGEPLAVTQTFFSKYGAFVMSGCTYSHDALLNTYTIQSGVVFIKHLTDGWKVARFSVSTGNAGANSGIIYINKVVTQKQYDDGNNHDAVYDYQAVVMWSDNPAFSATVASLTFNESFILFSPGDYLSLQSFERAYRKKNLTDFAPVGGSIISNTMINFADIYTRVNIAEGKVYIRGFATIVNPTAFGVNQALWLPVKVLNTVSAYPPIVEHFFSGQLRYGFGTGDYILEATSRDYIKNVSMSVHPATMRLNIGAVKPPPSGTYTVNFNTSYFFD